MSKQIIISDGVKTYDLVNQEGKLLGQISFNPHDINIIDRHKKVVEDLKKIRINFLEKKEQLGMNETIQSANEIIFEKINYLLNADVADSFFSIMGPLSPLENGQLYVEMIMDVIGNIIREELNKREENINFKIKKHTSKYTK